MEGNLHIYFSKTNFNLYEPQAGHLERFEQKLYQKKEKKIYWKWLSLVASVVLLVGFWLGNNHQQKKLNLADVSPEMEETQNYFITTINQELKEVEKHRNLDTEKIIEQAINQLEELEDNYKILIADLTKNGYEKRLIHAMINNYQKKILVLENVLEQIELIKNPKDLKNEKIYL